MKRAKVETGEIVRMNILKDLGRGEFLTDHGTLTWSDVEFDEALGLTATKVVGILLGEKNYLLVDTVGGEDGEVIAFDVII